MELSSFTHHRALNPTASAGTLQGIFLTLPRMQIEFLKYSPSPGLLKQPPCLELCRVVQGSDSGKALPWAFLCCDLLSAEFGGCFWETLTWKGFGGARNSTGNLSSSGPALANPGSGMTPVQVTPCSPCPTLDRSVGSSVAAVRLRLPLQLGESNALWCQECSVEAQPGRARDGV